MKTEKAFMDWKQKLQTRKITLNKNNIKKDLKDYIKFAIEVGADESKAIPAKLIKVDERVRMKCMVPKCYLYGSSPNCPPYTPDAEYMRKVLKKYKWAIIFKNEVKKREDFVDPKKWLKNHEKHQRKTHDITSAIESRAFNDGYYFAIGFSAGGCKTALCGGLFCQYLDSGRCRFPLKARPSMEGVGIDVFDIVTRIGWDIYPIASKYADPDSIKCAVSIGIVFIV